jgi:phosphoglycerol transferase MdoB-like AlkP superfamily enzyme
MSYFREQLQVLADLVKPFALFALATVAALFVCRVGFTLWHWDRVIDAGMLGNIFVQGLRFDIVLLGIVFAIPVLLFPVFCSNHLLLKAWRPFIAVYLPAWLTFIVFMEASSPSFINQFDARPNRLFIEYLVYPQEVLSMLWTAYRAQIIVVAVLLPTVFLAFRRRIQPQLERSRSVDFRMALLVAPVFLVLCTAMIRSTLDHRPVNPSTAALSSDPLANDLSLSSAYTVLYAAYESRLESEGGFRYGDMGETEVVSAVRESMMLPEADFVDEQLPTLHHQAATAHPATPRNLVIILEESLGAEYVGSMGGPPLTPRLDQLRNDGIWFENLYATGTRSVRGLEAVVTGFTPTPARSVVKLGKSQRGFFTLAELLQDQGYETSFIYGGEAHFDNMRRFFANNGFDTIVDRQNIDNPEFVGSWGASDEDIFRAAHERFRQPHGKPFFSLVFSVSNHSPYEFPDGRIELYDAEKGTVNNAVKYADWSLGHFFDNARQSDYWDNTIFLVVADHNSRVYGAELVPIEHFHIPGVILGGSIEPAVFTPVVSQIDLAPTLLSLMGISSDNPMIGHDLTRREFAQYPGRAIMQYNTTQAFMEGNNVVILQKDKAPENYRYAGGTLIPAEPDDPKIVTRAIAHSVWSSMAYEKSLYRMRHDRDHAAD